jgi:hypothetical protein
MFFAAGAGGEGQITPPARDAKGIRKRFFYFTTTFFAAPGPRQKHKPSTTWRLGSRRFSDPLAQLRRGPTGNDHKTSAPVL